MEQIFHEPSIQELLRKYTKATPDPLKIANALQNSRTPQERIWITEWASLASKTYEKLRNPAPLLCDRLALEQSTAHDLSSWKAALWPRGSRILDLCCGMGGDSFWIPPDTEIRGIDLDPLRCAMYRTNTAIFGRPREACCENALSPSLHADFFQIDPARRASLQGNQRRIADLTPNWPEIQSILPRFQGALLKLPPGFPIDELPKNTSLTYAGSQNDCRECLVGFGALAPEPGKVRALCLPDGLEFSAHHETIESLRLPVGDLGKFLCEPNPTLVRSHLFPAFAQPLGLWQIDSRIAYLTGDTLPAVTPWLNSFRVIDSCPLGTERVRTMLKFHGMKPITLKKRGVEVEPAEELRRFKAETGYPGVLFYTRVMDQKVAILTLPQGMM